MKSIQGENWKPIQNPFVIRDIEGSLEKAFRDYARRHGTIVKLKSSRLALKVWGLADMPEGAIRVLEKSSAGPSFMAELPHPETNTPLQILQSGPLTIMYYEDSRSIAQVEGAVPEFFKYLQMSVIVDQQRRPAFIVGVEEGSLGTSMLCAIAPSGTRSNLGQFARTSQQAFVSKSVQVAMEFGCWS